MSSSDDEYEEEVRATTTEKKESVVVLTLSLSLGQTMHLLVDLGKDISADLLSQLAKEDTEVLFLGLESGEPYIQIGNHTFRGEIDESVGTNLFFKINERPRETSGLLPLLTSMRKPEEGQQDDTTTTTTTRLPRITTAFEYTTQKVAVFERVTFVRREKAGNDKEITEVIA